MVQLQQAEKMTLRLTLTLVTSLVSVQGLTVTWNGTAITGPVLIYQDELVVDNRTDPEASPVNGTLICRSENQAQVGWHYSSGGALSGDAAIEMGWDFRQTRTGNGVTPSVSILKVRMEDASRPEANHANGLWTCRLNEEVVNPTPIFVGIYAREGDLGIISTNQVHLLSPSSFLSDPTTFTLFGNTSGGPPTTYMWTRDGQVISNNESFAISIAVDNSTLTRFQNSVYRSTLTVTGRLPGVYQYSVTNRAMSYTRSANFFVQGAPPTDIRLVQERLSVLVTWTEPLAPPANGYQVQIIAGCNTTLTATVSGASHFFILPDEQYLVDRVRVQSLSQHLPGEATEVTVRAPTRAPGHVVASTTSTSVRVSWDVVQCNGEITGYTVVFQEQGGAEIPGEVNVMDRTFTASGLAPHTNYTFRVAAVNNIGTAEIFSEVLLTTDEDVPGPVSGLTAQPRFTSVVLTWSAPQEPNGVLISYEVTYRASDGDLVTTNTTDLTFNIPSLTSRSSISVSAYTSVGRGEAINVIIIPICQPTNDVNSTSVAVVTTFLLTILLNSTIISLICCVYRRNIKPNVVTSKSDKEKDQSIYEEMDTTTGGTLK